MLESSPPRVDNSLNKEGESSASVVGTRNGHEAEHENKALQLAAQTDRDIFSEAASAAASKAAADIATNSGADSESRRIIELPNNSQNDARKVMHEGANVRIESKVTDFKLSAAAEKLADKRAEALAEQKIQQQPKMEPVEIDHQRIQSLDAQIQQIQHRQDHSAQNLKYSSDRDRVRWNQTPTHAPTQGEVSKIGEAALPTPKPVHLGLPSFPSIPEHGSLNHHQYPGNANLPLVSPALSTMTTGSSGWHDWEDNFDYGAVDELAGAKVRTPKSQAVSTPKEMLSIHTGGSDIDLLGKTENSGITAISGEQLNEASTASVAMAAARSGSPNILNSMQKLAPELSSPLNAAILKQQQQHHQFQQFQEFQRMQRLQAKQQFHQDLMKQSNLPASVLVGGNTETFQEASRTVTSHKKGKKAQSNAKASQVRCVVYQAGEKFGEPVGQGQLMTIPKRQSEHLSPAEAKELFQEFLYEAAVRLGLAQKLDPLVAPPSPSRRRRVSILKAEVERLEEDLTRGRHVDTTFLHGLKNKLEVLQLGDDATRLGARAQPLGSESDSSRSEFKRRNGMAKSGYQSPRPEDLSHLSLWHSKYRAQIRDFSSIRDGDALLLRSLKPSENKKPNKTKTKVVAQLPNVKDGANTLEELPIGSNNSGIFESSSGSLLGMDSKSGNENRRTRSLSQQSFKGGSNLDKGGLSLLEYEMQEDRLRLRRIGLSQLLNAIRSKRTLFGKKLKGARQAFAAMDRDGDGLISAEDLKTAMHRLDIRLSKPATLELIALINKGAFKSTQQLSNTQSISGNEANITSNDESKNMLRISDFIDLLQTVADDPEDNDGRDWLGEGASITLSGMNASISMQSTTLMGGRHGQRRKRRRRLSYRDPTPDTRPDEELMWDIESNVNDPVPLRAFAERLIVRGQPGRAIQYLQRALQMAERQNKENGKRLSEYTTARANSQSGRLVNTFGVEESPDGMDNARIEDGGSVVVGDNDTINLKYEPEGSFALLSHKAQVRNLGLRLELMQCLGTVYAYEEQYGAAQQIFEEAIHLAPVTLDYDEGLKDVSTASANISVVLDSGLITVTKASPLGLLGSLLERIREYDKAEEAYLRALAIDPEHTHSLIGLANLLADVRGDSKGAEIYYVRAVSAANKDFNDANMPLKGARRNMLECLRCFAVFKHRLQGDYVGALSLLRQAVEVPTPVVNAHSGRSKIQKHREARSRKQHVHPDKASVLVEMGKIELARLADDPSMSTYRHNNSAMGTASDGGIDKRKGGSILGAVVELFESALEACPEHQDAKVQLAMLLSQRSRAPRDRIRATELFEEALSVDPEHAQALLALAQHLDFTSQGAPRYVEDLYIRAIKAVDAMYRAAPRSNMPLSLKLWEPRLAFATFLEFRRLDAERAQIEYENAVKVAPHEPAVLCALAVFKATPPAVSGPDSIDIDGAEALFRAALDSDPLHCESLVGLADLLWNRKGEHTAAEALLKRAVGVVETLMQKNSDSRRGGAQTSNAKGKQMKRNGKKNVTMLNPPIGGPSGRAGESHADPGFLAASVYRQYAMFLASRGQHKFASKMFLKSIKCDPTHAATRTAYALVLAYHIRDYELAEQQLLRSLELSPDSPETLHHLGRLYEEHVIALSGVTSDGGAKSRLRAMKCYQNCLEIDPDHVPTLVRMGTLLADKANVRRGSASNRMADRG